MIIEEIADYRASELKSGRTPTEISLNKYQRDRLEAWMESTRAVFVAPDGERRVVEPIDISEGAHILGMKIKYV